MALSEFDPERVERLEPELDWYRYGGVFAKMTEHPQGGYVTYADYLKLQEQYRNTSPLSR